MADAIDPQQLQAAIDSPDPLAVIDLRESLDYAEGHITECTLVRRHELEYRIESLVPNRKTPIVLVDREGDRAPDDVRWLRSLGYADVSYLEDGMDAWRDADLPVVEAVGNVHSTAFNFESKKFGELVEASESLPKIQPEDLQETLGDQDPLIVDVRTPQEYEWVTIPGSINVEGVDLGLYIDELRDSDDQPVVVHCAGRTRSIIGTATLKKLGVENIYELENGTMGWELAGFDPEIGAKRHISRLELDDERHARLRKKAEGLLAEQGIDRITPAELDELERSVDEKQTIYRFDVRTEAEYADGHLPGAVSIPGGQAIQTTDQHVAVRDAEIVFYSNSHVRSAITAYWFAEMEFERISVLDGGLEGWKADNRSIETGADDADPLGWSDIVESVPHVDPDELDEAATIIDVSSSEDYEEGHLPGARWAPRYRLENILAEEFADTLTVLVCPDGSISTYAAAQSRSVLGRTDISVLAGGAEAWVGAGHDLESGTDGMLTEPRDAVMKPYFQGEAEMRAYLEWEKELAEG